MTKISERRNPTETSRPHVCQIYRNANGECVDPAKQGGIGCFVCEPRNSKETNMTHTTTRTTTKVECLRSGHTFQADLEAIGADADIFFADCKRCQSDGTGWAQRAKRALCYDHNCEREHDLDATTWHCDLRTGAEGMPHIA